MRALIRIIVAYWLIMLAAAATAATGCAGLSVHGGPRQLRITATTVTAGFNLPSTYYRLPPAILHFGAGASDGSPYHEAPVAQAFCRLEAVAPTQIRFEIWLPLKGWNGRLLGVGNGAMAGAIPYPALQAGLAEGYAVVGSDLGHEGPVTDASFALGHPELLADWGHRATHVMTVEAKKAVQAFYGKAPSYSYFAGCSGGGRQAMMEAQRYPADYDGILAGDPIMNFTKLVIAGRLWGQLAMMRESHGAGYIPATKIPAIAAAVVAACDKLDGVADGVIENPRSCRFDPRTMACKASDGPDCLTAPQAAALAEIYRGAHDSRGRPLFSGYSPGGELGPGGWALYVSGTGPWTSGQWNYAKGVLPVLLWNDPKHDIRTVDYDTDVDRALTLPILGEPLGSVIDAYNPDLSRFAARGGKLIHFHGWSDPGVPPLNSVGYYQMVVDRFAASEHLSRAEALARVRRFYRLFMAPGMQHCIDGPGPNRFDGLTPLRLWVEHGTAPARIEAAHITNGAVDRTRPLCPFPETARWEGKGSTDRAASFACVAPAG